MELKYLETFVMVNELRSFTHAAKRLGYTQSTVSFQIRQLEQELSLPLFERTNHAVTLTNEGEKFLPIAHEILHLSARAYHLSGQEAPHGLIRIAVANSLSTWQLQNHFIQFHRTYPGIRLKIINASTDQMFQLLGQNQVDLVYTLDRPIFNHKYFVAFEAPVSVFFVASSSHPLASGKKISMQQVLDGPLILTERNMSYRAILDEHLAQNGYLAKPILEVGDTHLICDLLMQEAALSFLPEFVAREYLDQGLLVRLDVQELETTISRQLIYPRNKWISPELQCVIDHLTE